MTCIARVFYFTLALLTPRRSLACRSQANVRKLAKVSEAFDGIKKDEKKRKYRAQGKEEERLKKARNGGGGGRGGRRGGRDGDDD